MTQKEQKFLDKNKEEIIKLDKFIDENKDNISLIIISFELFCYYFKNSDKFKLINNENFSDFLGLYKDVRVLGSMYHSTENIGFVMINDYIKLNVPCVCGIYSDEDHDHRLK
jgi:hypothetical protein